tara:strand:+ start:19542 stop:19976 length:435 start_codon:yes stop_codon:yes gene_type:complete
MISSFRHQLGRIFKLTLAIFISTVILLMPFNGQANAGKTSMTGDYVKDTINVIKTLKDEIILIESDNDQSMSKEEKVFLVTDYISRYRNRSQVNQTVSFTTMQTALNAVAGHYKTFPNRPVPDSLKDRLNKELSKAEDLVLKQS